MEEYRPQHLDITSRILDPLELKPLPHLRPFNNEAPATDARDMAGRVWKFLFNRRHIPTDDEVLAGVKRDSTTVKALGWLAREGMWRTNLWGEETKPERCEYHPEDDDILRKPPVIHEIYSDWQMEAGVDSRYRDAFRRAFEYGMWRRQETYERPVVGEDEAIGSTAGRILKHMFQKTPPESISTIIQDIYDYRSGSQDVVRGEMIAVATGLGWLVHENKVILEGQEELKVNLAVQETSPHEKNDMVRAQAEKVMGSLRESKGESELIQLLEKNEGVLGNAIALGYLLRDNRIRLEPREENVFVIANA